MRTTHLLALAAVLRQAQAIQPTAWVVESQAYADSLQAAVGFDNFIVEFCGPRGEFCLTPAPGVSAVVGRADALNLTQLAHLRLVQSTSYFHTDARAVPPWAGHSAAAV